MFLIRQKLMACAAGAAMAFVLSGCGGTTLSKESVAPSPASDPVVEGLQPNAAAGAGAGSLTSQYEETSGLGSPDSTTAYITGAVDSDSTAIPGIAISTSPSNPSVSTTPLGFAPGGLYFTSQGGAPFPSVQAATPAASVIFRAAIANGVDPTTNPPSAPPLVPSSIKLTSTDPAWSSVAGLKTDDPTDAPNGYLPMAFDAAFANAPSGPLANDNYVTGTPDASGNLTGNVLTFALPFTTTGLHNLRVTVADTRNVVHHTDFQTLIVAPTDVVIIVQAVTSLKTFTPVGGAKVTLDSGQITPTAPAVDQTMTDPLTGVAIIFATPTNHTITITGKDAKGNTITGTGTVDLTALAGKIYNTADAKSPYQILVAAPATGSIQLAHSIKNTR